MKCRWCRTEHPIEELCGVSRRSFFFIAGGALGAALAPLPSFWEPYRLPCVTCAGSIVSYSKEIIESAEKAKFDSKEGYWFPKKGPPFTNHKYDIFNPKREHLF